MPSAIHIDTHIIAFSTHLKMCLGSRAVEDDSDDFALKSNGCSLFVIVSLGLDEGFIVGLVVAPLVDDPEASISPEFPDELAWGTCCENCWYHSPESPGLKDYRN